MPLRAVLFDIGDTLWAFPGDDPSVAVPHLERMRSLFTNHAAAPPAKAMLGVLQERFGREREESPRREPRGTQKATWLLAKEAFAALGFEPANEELQTFADLAFDFEAGPRVRPNGAPYPARILFTIRSESSSTRSRPPSSS